MKKYGLANLASDLPHDDKVNMCYKHPDIIKTDLDVINCIDGPQSNIVYLDNNATTQVDDRVLEVMFNAFKNCYGNPHSRGHILGWRSESLLEEYRVKIANVINAQPSEIVFTSGATESNNLAIKGVARFYKTETKNHIITASTEHKCVIESCRCLESEGFDVTFLKPKKDGILDLDEIESSISEKTILISIMAVNNEIGVIQNIEQIGRIARERGVFFHTDAAQAFGKMHLDVESMNIDLMSISSHKIYGPKGIGGLYVRKNPRVRLIPLFSGGGQERGLRSGTAPTPLIVGFGKAAEICQNDFQIDSERITNLSNRLYDGIIKIPEVYLNGSYEHRYRGNLNFSFSFVEGESLIMAIKGLAVSSGSACTSASLEPSYVLNALGLKDELAHSSIRFGIGRFTTKEDIDYALDVIFSAVKKLRNMSPLWDMFKAGIDLDSVKWTNH